MRLSKLSFVVVGVACAILSATSPAGAAVLEIATGPDPLADGYYSVFLDEYGASAHVTFGGGGDNFNPLGPLLVLPATFSSGFFLFVPGPNNRELLTDNVMWQDSGVSDFSMERNINGAFVASDTNGDGVPDRLDSRFQVFGDQTFLQFDLIQHVSVFANGVSFLRQIYTVTNICPCPAISFNMVRAFDGDLDWSGSFENDEVGTTMQGAGLGSYVFEQEASDPAITAITLSGERQQAMNYFGGKRGVTPGGGPPAYSFGTATQVWNAGGIPTSWLNHIAGVGYNTNGLSGTAPPGSTPPEDGFIGLDFSVVDLALNASTTILMVHTFGQNFPVDPCPEDCQEFPSDAVEVPDLLALLGAWGGPQTPGTTCDLDGSGTVAVPDLLTLLAAWGPCP